MSTPMLDEPLAGKPPKPRPSAETARDRIDLRAEPAWVARIERQAERFGMPVSVYIRQAVTMRLEQDEATDPQHE